MTKDNRASEHLSSAPIQKSLLFHPTVEPMHVMTHIVYSVEDATTALVAADVLGLGVRLRNEERSLPDDGLEITWALEIWSSIFPVDDDEEDDEAPGGEE